MENNDTNLQEKLSRLQWLLHRQQMQAHSQRGPMADPTRGQGRVMALLKMQPEVSTKDLSYLLGIRQQSLNELLGKLEKAGYVTRTPSEKDRRVMLVQLTEKGKAEQQTEADTSGLFDCLNPEEQAAFGDYLDRVIAALEGRLGVGEDEEMSGWMDDARARMGDEMFDHLMSMRGAPRPRPHPHGHGGFEGFGGCGHRGPGPENMPGGERFSLDYDGPMPHGRGPGDFGRNSRPAPPPPPPKGPREPEDK